MADVGELKAKLTLDTAEFQQGVSETEGLASGLASKIGGVLGGVASAVGAAVAASAAAVGSLVKDSVSSFAEYEQLVGGAQKIFDEMDYSKIAEDASSAWQTMNLSASQYLEMINSVGAAFSSTMGDEAGYEAAKTGMQAIADYASGTGRNVEELNQKFALITRSTQSYQSIADQFSGILPATSAQFLEQAQAAGLLGQQYEELTNVPIAEYQQAVSEMLQRGVDALGLTNNTVMETEGTITGSLAGMKAAWENLMTGLADSSADLGPLFDNVVTMAQAAFNNLLPAVQQALNGIAQLVTNLAPMIGDAIPGLVNTLIPMAIDAAMSLVNALIGALPSMADAISNAAIGILPGLVTAFVGLLDALLSNLLPKVIEIGINLVLELGRGISQNVGNLMSTVIDLVNFLIDTLLTNLPAILEVGLQIILAIAEGLVDNLPKIADAVVGIIPAIIDAVVESLPILLELGMQIILKIAEGILLAIPMLVTKVLQLFDILPKSASKSSEEASKAYKSMTTDISSSTDALGRSLQASSDNFASLSKSANSSMSSVDKLSNDAASKINDASVKMATSSKINEQEFSKNMNNIQISADAAASGVSGAMRDMANAVEGAASKIASACASINSSFSSISSPTISTSGLLIGGGRASGGSVKANVPYITGEKGAELFVPSTNGYIYNADDTSDILDRNSGTVININGDIYDDARSMREKLRSAVMGILEEQLAYG